MPTIRPEQMQVFSREAQMSFRKRLEAHVREFFPEALEALGAEGLVEEIYYAIRRATFHGFQSEVDIAHYVNLVFLLNSDFDADPALDWAGKILRERIPADPTQRMNKLRRESETYFRSRS